MKTNKILEEKNLQHWYLSDNSEDGFLILTIITPKIEDNSQPEPGQFADKNVEKKKYLTVMYYAIFARHFYTNMKSVYGCTCLYLLSLLNWVVYKWGFWHNEPF